MLHLWRNYCTRLLISAVRTAFPMIIKPSFAFAADRRQSLRNEGLLFAHEHVCFGVWCIIAADSLHRTSRTHTNTKIQITRWRDVIWKHVWLIRCCIHRSATPLKQPVYYYISPSHATKTVLYCILDTGPPKVSCSIWHQDAVYPLGLADHCMLFRVNYGKVISLWSEREKRHKE